MPQDQAPGDGKEQSARKAEPQVRHDVSDGKKRCGSALPATTDLAGRPLVLPSVDLLERGIGTFSSMDICRLKGIVDSQSESLSEEAKTATHWRQVQEEDDEREAKRAA